MHLPHFNADSRHNIVSHSFMFYCPRLRLPALVAAFPCRQCRDVMSPHYNLPTVRDSWEVLYVIIVNLMLRKRRRTENLRTYSVRS